MKHLIKFVLAYLLFVAGCASPMQMSSQKTSALAPTEGLVFGSVQIKIVDYSEPSLLDIVKTPTGDLAFHGGRCGKEQHVGFFDQE